MPRKKLTDLGIENLKAPKIGRIEINDSLIHQLAIRVTAKGQKTFSVRTRINDAYRKQVRITIGTFPPHSVADAREKARDVLLTAQRGIDPNEVKRQERDEAVRERANTVAEVCDIFIKRYAKKKHKHWQKTERTLRNHVLPKWGHKPFREFAASNINDLIDDINDNAGPFAANDILKILKVLMPWAEGRKIIAEAPVLKKIQRTEENERDRYLTESELPSFWAACEAVGYPFGPLFRLLLLTGQRRSEVASMRWSQIDGNDVWTLPSEITKSGREHRIPLSDLALQVLAGLPRIVGQDLVFASTKGTVLNSFSKAKSHIDKAACLSTPWRIHDLRRTFGSLAEEKLRIMPYLVGDVLNHSPKKLRGITATYTRGDLLEIRRDNLQMWGQYLSSLVDPQSQLNVVALPRQVRS